MADLKAAHATAEFIGEDDLAGEIDALYAKFNALLAAVEAGEWP